MKYGENFMAATRDLTTAAVKSNKIHKKYISGDSQEMTKLRNTKNIWGTNNDKKKRHI